MLKASTILLIALFIQSFFNYGFHFSMGRLLSVEDYGDLGAINSLINVLAVPCLTVLFVVSKFISTYKAEGDISKMKYLYEFLIKRVSLLGIFAFGSIAVASVFLKEYLNMASVVPVIILGIGVVSMFYLQTIMGVVKGLQKFNAYAINLILYGGLKFLIALVLVYAGFELSGAVSGLSFMPLILSVVFAIYLNSLFKGQKKHVIPLGKKMLRYGIFVFVANAILMGLVFSDILIAPSFFNDFDMGLYASAGTIGRTVFFIPATIVLALFPMVAEGYAKKAGTRGALIKGLSLALGLGLLVSMVFYIWGEQIILLVYGARYNGAGIILNYYGFALIPISLINVFMNYELAKERYYFVLIMLVALLMQISLMFLYHDSLLEILAIVFASTSVCAFMIMVYNLMKRWRFKEG